MTADLKNSSEADWRVVNPELEPLTGWEMLSDDVGGRHSYLVEYYKRCRRGEIVIGRELMTMLEVLAQYIVMGTYRFDPSEAHKRIRFIETKLKHFESPFAGQPFILELFQKALIEAVFGFYIFDESLLTGARWVRLFKEVLFFVARKNGKTPLIGAIFIAEWFCGEMGQKIMCASNDYDQAAILFDCINNFREESAELERVTHKNVQGIFFGGRRQKQKRGKFSWQNKGWIKKFSARKKTREGRNLKAVAVDEVHEMADRATVAPLRSSLTTQDEPLYFEITSEGLVRDGYLDERLALARKTLRGEISRPRWLIFLYTQDSEAEIWNDERSWQKANPLLGVAKKKSELRELLEEARISGTQRVFTLAKEFNLKQSASGAWLDEKLIDCPGTFTLEEFRGMPCIVGVDLAETNDLCAVTYLFMKKGSPIKYLFTMYFVTEAKAGDDFSTESPTNPERRNYRDWAQKGLCRIVEGNVIDDDVVANYLWEVYKAFDIRPMLIGYDAWHAKEFARICVENFNDESVTRVKMSCESLNSPMRTLEADLRARIVNYNGNEICRWCFRNTAVRYDRLGFVMPEKRQGYVGNKIDGTMSKVIAYAALRECKSRFMDAIA